MRNFKFEEKGEPVEEEKLVKAIESAAKKYELRAKAIQK